jgi:hypothetical protein
VPCAAARGGLRVPAALVLAGALASGSPGAGVVLLGFGIFLAGLVRALGAARCPVPAAAGLASLLGCGLLVLPFLGDPLVEARGPGKGSPAAIAALVGGSPLAAAVGGGLGVDLLKTPRAYGSSGGGLSRIGAYYAYAYPRPAAAGAGWAAAGLLLAAGAGLARRRAGP